MGARTQWDRVATRSKPPLWSFLILARPRRLSLIQLLSFIEKPHGEGKAFREAWYCAGWQCWEYTLLQQTSGCFCGSRRLGTNTQISRLATCFLPSSYQEPLTSKFLSRLNTASSFTAWGYFFLPPNRLHKNSYLQSPGKRGQLAADGHAQNVTAGFFAFLACPSGRAELRYLARSALYQQKPSLLPTPAVC